MMKFKSSFSNRRLRIATFCSLKWLCLILLFAVSGMVYAQTKSISGTVKDENGEAIIGANVRVVNTANGTITDVDGRYTLNVPNRATIEVTYIGYQSKRLTIGTASVYDFVLTEDSKALEEVVVVGYGTQKKATLTGSVSAVQSEELNATKNQNAQNMLTGKVAGVRVIQKTSEPGELNNQFDIRGFGSPLVVVDGVPRGNLERLDPNEIESISVLKDASAAVYGIKGGNGVVLITTKQGKKDQIKIQYNMYYGLQTPAEILEPVGAVERMQLYNDKSMRNLTNPQLIYSDEQMAEYLNGTKQSTDWYGALLRNAAPQQQHNVSASGGSELMDFFVNFGYTDQESFLKYNAQEYKRYNLRANLNAQVTKHLKATLRLNGILDNRDRSHMSSWELFKSLWRSKPDDPIYANNTAPYYLKPTSGDIQNVVAAVQHELGGWVITRNRIFQSTMELEYAVPYIKGLKAKGSFSYDNWTGDNEDWNRTYDEYTYNASNDSYTATARQSPSKLTRSYGNNYTTLWNVQLNYDNTFANDHHVSGLLLFEEKHSEGDNINASRYFSLDVPYLFAGNATDQVGTASTSALNESVNQSIVGRFNYDYKSRYMTEFAFRYDGASSFAPNHHWVFSPAVLLAWRISEESFIKDNQDFLQNLKIRASWGRMADDGAMNYQFLTGYTYPNTSGDNGHGGPPKGYLFNGSFTNSLGFMDVANPDIFWYTNTTMNIGVDADLWHELFGFTFELFRRDRDGLLGRRTSTVPGTFGANLPQVNINSDRTVGFELELRHHHRIGDLRYGVTGLVSMTRGMIRHNERNPAGNSYDRWRNHYENRYNDIWFGYGANGRYTSYAQIQTAPLNAGNSALPGDYIYEDWNGDGIIDDMDRHPIATTTNPTGNDINKQNYPLMNLGLTLNADWKGLDANLLFQGSTMSYVSYGEQLAAPLAWDGNALELFMDRWHPTDPKQDPYNPATQWISGYYSFGGTTPDVNSRFAIQDGTYVRLKSAEIGYTLPKHWLVPTGIKSLRVYVNAYNLITFTGVKGVDPEKPAQQYGYMYPLNKTFNFGANVTF